MSQHQRKRPFGATNTKRPNEISLPSKDPEQGELMLPENKTRSTLKTRPRRDFTVECEIVHLTPATKVAVFADGNDYWTEPVDMVAAVRRYCHRPRGQRERIGDLIVPARLHDSDWFIEGTGYDTYRGMIDPGDDPKSIPALGIDASAKLVPSPTLTGEVSS